MDNKQNMILHPLLCIYKLALIGCLENGTKLSINNYVLSISPPSSYQFVSRLKNADTRENISQIYVPIIKALKWYVLTEDPEYYVNLSKETSVFITDICGYAIVGLKKLQNTYGSHPSLVTMALQLCINIINDAIVHNKIDYNHLINQNDVSENGLADKIKSHCNEINTRKLREFYYNLYNADLSTVDHATYIECVTSILDAEDRKFQDFMYRINTKI